jgi:hypothetical protein
MQPAAGEYSEEHYEDTIELSDVRPPVFIQGINSYRITNDVRLAIPVEVNSRAPIVFEW